MLKLSYYNARMFCPSLKLRPSWRSTDSVSIFIAYAAEHFTVEKDAQLFSVL
jgi:hypothetical protein